MATLINLFSLEIWANLIMQTQRDSLVHAKERDRHTDLGSNLSFDLPLRWDPRQITQMLRFTFPICTVRRCYLLWLRIIMRIWEISALKIRCRIMKTGDNQSLHH